MKIEKRFSNSAVSYDPETGEFLWIKCYRKPWMVGKTATRAMTNGYLYIKADGKQHSASRLAWELINGRAISRDLEIDHVNRINHDNRISNLRVVDRAGNLRNRILKPGVSGVLGVRIYNRPTGNGHLWRATIDGKIKYFKTKQAAIDGYANGQG